MDKTNIFPIILIGLDLCASMIYIIDGQYAKGVYWIMAGGLTTTTLFM